jgi:tetratricopeptide (TPR) repeat protein
LYSKSAESNAALFGTVELGVLPVLRDAGVPITGELLGALALSYAETQDNRSLAAKMLREGGAASPAGRVAVAVLRAKQGEVVDLMPILARGLEEQPQSFTLRLRRSELLYEQEDYEAALAEARAALALRPDDPRARTARVSALLDLDRASEALPEAEALASSSFTRVRPDVWLKAAAVHSALGEHEEAVGHARRFALQQSTEPHSWFVLSQYYRLAGRTKEREEAMENGRRALRNAAVVRHAAALRAERNGDLDEARKLLEQAVELAPDYRPAGDDLRRLTQPPPV